MNNRKIQERDAELYGALEGMLRRHAYAEITETAEALAKDGMSESLAGWLFEQASTWHMQGRFTEQRKIYALVAPYARQGWEIWHGLGYAAQLQGGLAEAESCYVRALALKPDYAYAQIALAQVRMQRSNFRQGRDLYEARFAAHGEHDGIDWRMLPLPRWRGENLRGKRLYLWAEQGLGDVVWFSSFLPHILAQQPARIVLGMFPKLVSLFARSFPEVTVESAQHACDYAIALPPGLRETLSAQMRWPSQTMPHSFRRTRRSRRLKTRCGMAHSTTPRPWGTCWYTAYRPTSPRTIRVRI